MVKVCQTEQIAKIVKFGKSDSSSSLRTEPEQSSLKDILNVNRKISEQQKSEFINLITV